MGKIGFDNDQYVRLQSERIRQRINKFGGKLYLCLLYTSPSPRD